MRKVIIFILVLLIILFTSVIVIDERQNAVITSYSGETRVETRGIHIAWPFWDKVTYVFINERTALLSLAISMDDKNAESAAPNAINIQVLINYHVINPIEYLAAIRKLGKPGVSEQISKILVAGLTDKINTATLDKFNQEALVSIDKSKFAGMGISIDTVGLLNIKPIVTVPIGGGQESATVVLSQSDNSIESAYYQASVIKSKTKLDVDTINQKMQIKDPKFYEYFKKLKTYEQDAKTKADVPPLSQLQN
jgi:hypothetical protein